MTLISADNDFAMWAVMLLLVALAFKLEKTTIGQLTDENISQILDLFKIT